jgi:hypothetical protein
MLAAEPNRKARLVSLDQFRGYTVAGMFLVNFFGGFAVTPAILKHHHTYCSYADTIMPQFLFAVGFAFRLTFGRRAKEQGMAAAYLRVARRLGGLVLLSLVIYTIGGRAPTWDQFVERGIWGALAEPFKRNWFQTLMHIAVTSLWILPVIRAGTIVRVFYLLFSAGAHVALSAWFNFTWVNTPPNAIDGGPLGFLTWSIPALVGTFACDAMTAGTGFRVRSLLVWSWILMVLGYALSCGTRLYDVAASEQHTQRFAESPVIPAFDGFAGRDVASVLAEPPFVPPPGPEQRQLNYWMMSQRSGSVSYLTFAAGFSLAVFVLFHLLCDRLDWQLGLFRTFGTNALAAYVLGGMVDTAVSRFVPRDAPNWYVAAAFGVFFGLTYIFVRHLEKNGLLLRM